MSTQAPPPSESLELAIIGAGALGATLARRLAGTGFRIQAVISRSLEPARNLAAEVHAPMGSTDLADLPPGINLIFCCVPDDAIPVVARTLADQRRTWGGTVIAHTSGALTASALSPLDERGASLLSFHPMQTFPPGSPPGAFEGIYVGLEGDPAAVALGSRIATALGAIPLIIPTEAKSRYHLAGSIASNFAVTLAALARDVLESIGISYEQGRALLAPLVAATLHNLSSMSPEEALTGPLVRGDRETVAAHLHALYTYLPRLVPVYVALAAETVRLAQESKRLAGDEAFAMLQLLHSPAPEGDLR